MLIKSKQILAKEKKKSLLSTMFESTTFKQKYFLWVTVTFEVYQAFQITAKYVKV